MHIILFFNFSTSLGLRASTSASFVDMGHPLRRRLVVEANIVIPIFLVPHGFMNLVREAE